MTKLISIVTPCYNEEENVALLYQKVKDVFSLLPHYRYEHLFINNHSSDGTVSILRRLAASGTNVKIMVNARNFGHIRSPHHAILQTRGQAVMRLAMKAHERIVDDPDIMFGKPVIGNPRITVDHILR